MAGDACILGIESTCDETAAAVVRGGHRVLSSVVAGQDELHAKFGGVVPEIASRRHVEAVVPVVTEALERAGLSLGEVDAIAVAHRPGLIGSLLVGLTAAKTLAWAADKPVVGIDHVKAHLWSVMLGEAGAANASPLEVPMPAVGLVASGGHTSLFHVEHFGQITCVGSTIDDAVGEAYDKVSAMLRLGYPGGPAIDRLAASGDPAAVDFPRSLLSRDSLDFSFSGLKTAVKYHVFGKPGALGEARTGPVEHMDLPLNQQQVADVAASFQRAVVETILIKLRRAIDRFDAKSVIVGGGVSANRALRAALDELPVPAFRPRPEYCTDNAAMVAGLGAIELGSADRAADRVGGLSLDAVTNCSIPVAGAS